MPSITAQFFFDVNYGAANDSVFTLVDKGVVPPPPPPQENFLLLDGTDFLLLDGENLTLL
jgi:hypothetical protein